MFLSTHESISTSDLVLCPYTFIWSILTSSKGYNGIGLDNLNETLLYKTCTHVIMTAKQNFNNRHLKS